MDRRGFVQSGTTGVMGWIGGMGLQSLSDAAVPTISALQKASVSSGKVVYVEGRDEPGDGGSGFFVWNRQRASKNLDGGTNRAQDALWVRSRRSGAGHWFRIVPGEAINVRWFGAKGDGDTDDAPAIEDAIWVAGYLEIKTTFVPAGTYRICTPVVIPWTSGQTLKGQSAESTTIVRDGSATYTLRRGQGDAAVHAALVVPIGKTGQGGFADSFNVAIQNLALKQSEVPLESQTQDRRTERYGVFLESAYRCRLENLKVDGFHTSVYGAKTWLSRLSQVYTNRCVNFIHMVGRRDVSYAAASTSLDIRNCYCSGTVFGDGYILSTVFYSTIQDCAADKVKGWPYRIRNSRGISLIGCGFEQSLCGKGILFEGSVGVISGCKAIYPHVNTELDEQVSTLAARDLEKTGSNVTVIGSHFGNYVSSSGNALPESQVDQSRNAAILVENRSNVAVIGSRLSGNAPARDGKETRGKLTRVSSLGERSAVSKGSGQLQISLDSISGSDADEAINENFRRLAEAVQKLSDAVGGEL